MALSSLVALGRHTITGMLCAGAEQFVDWSAAYRLFGKERINKDALFTPARNAVEQCLKHDEPMVVMMDDTLVRKRGRKIPGTGWKRDPLGPHFCTNFVWGQRFLQISAALPDDHVPGGARGIPIDFVHAPSAAKPRKNASDELWQEYRRQQQLARVSGVGAERLKRLRQQVNGKTIICAVDGGFTNKTVFRDIPEDMIMIGRIRKDARLFALPEDAVARRGRKRWYGEDLPTPEQTRQNDDIPWQAVSAYASGKHHQFEVKTLAPVRWQGTGDRDISVIIIRPLAYRPRKGSKLLYRNPVYLLCTDTALPLEKILQSYLWRWEIELNFRDEKTVMGAGQAQVRNKASVESAPALVVAAYSLLLLAATANGGKTKNLPQPKWRKKIPEQRQTTQQMISLFRSQLWKIGIEANKTHFASEPYRTQTIFYSPKSLSHAVCYAFK